MNIVNLPPPIKGLNTTKIGAFLAPEEATVFENWFAEKNYVRIRNGISVYTGDVVGTKDIKTICSFCNQGASTRKLIACGDNAIYDISTSTPDEIDLPVSYTISNNYWDTTNFVDSGGNSYLVMCNGADIPLMYNGATLAKSAWTGVTQTLLTRPLSYKGRLYFIEKDSLSIWYGSTGVSGASASALTEFDLSSVVSLSGKIIWHGSWSHDFGNGLNDYYAIVTSEGEFLVYGGIYPGDTSWGLLTRGLAPKPVSYRCFAKLGNDVLFLSINGELYSLGSVVQKNWKSLSENISESLSYCYTKSGITLNADWNITLSQSLGFIYIVTPIVTGKSKVFVGNLKTLSSGYIPWSEYSGIRIQQVVDWSNALYASSYDGYVYKLEQNLSYDYVYDNNVLVKKPIYTRMKTAPVKFSADGRNVQILCAKPLFVGSGLVKYNIGAEFDYETYNNLSTDGETESSADSISQWDVAEWDSAKWTLVNLVSKKWRRLHGVGSSCNLRLESYFIDSVVKLGEITIGFKNGGY